MENRREFIKKAGLLAGTLGMFHAMPKSIQAALQIHPKSGSTYLDAEHIVLLMQENRSFDHSFGSLRGVRGFNDSRAAVLPDGRPVWLQSYKNGDTYLPFRLDIKNSNAAWTRDLPHAWENQIGAWNHGRFNNWLESKRSGNKKYKDIPLTLGYYTRQDMPFYYAFADAFTICDQHFCSSITGTTTNRHFFWTGTCVPEKGAKPLVRNSDVYFNRMARWKTFPERLEESRISWKIYQNETSIQNELSAEAESWLGNFTNNNLEWFEQYHIRFKKSHMDFYQKRIEELPDEIKTIAQDLENRHDQKLQKKLLQKKQQLESFKKEYDRYNQAQFERLDPVSQSLHHRAFQTNEGDPDYHDVEKIAFQGQEITVPKGDVLHQFRQDVQQGTLPTVSWICAPQNFSDHPSAPMYGAWYVSEILNILTQDPEIWKKTIFILNYDENDGYFDHIPPFVAPKPGDPSAGGVSSDLDCSAEYVTKEQELQYGVDERYATEGPVGLGYRVPLIIASPWSKGGWVNSEVFDITSTLQFLEHFITKKFGVELYEENISSWRRAITGDLTSVFRPYTSSDKERLPEFVDRDQQIAAINKAREEPAPNTFRKLSAHQIAAVKEGRKLSITPGQEHGIKPSNALCYELYIQEQLRDNHLHVRFESRNTFFGDKALGGVFNVYAYGYIPDRANWSFACSAGHKVAFDWDINDFKAGAYHLAIYGPNGFYRSLQGVSQTHEPEIHLSYDTRLEELVFQISHSGPDTLRVRMLDAYADRKHEITLAGRAEKEYRISVKKQKRWYDIEISLPDSPYRRKYAGRLENGKDSITDPLMSGSL